MGGYSGPYSLEDDDLLDPERRLPAKGEPAQPIQSAPAAGPRIAKPSSGDSGIPPVTLRGISPQRKQDETELNRLESTGSGISQLQHKGGIKGVLGTGLRVLSGIGSAVLPGIMSEIPGTDLHHDSLVSRARNAVAGDIKNEGEVAQADQAAAQTQAIPATVAHTEAETEALKNPQPKQGVTPEETTIHDLMTGENGQPRLNPQTNKPYSYLEAYQAVKQAAQDVKPEKTPTPAHVTYDNGIPVSVVDSKGAVYDVNDPKLPQELKPLVDAANRAHGQHVKEQTDQQARAFGHQEDMFNEHQKALTAATKSMVEAAPGVLSLSARVRQLVQQQKDSLGPAASRWSEFMAGKVGAPNPEFTKLRTDVGLLTTKLMRMHVGARGGEQMMQHFNDLINVGKQSPENMLAALDEIDQYAKDTAAEGGGGQQQATQGGGGGAQYQEGQTATGPKGEKIKFTGGKWVPIS